MNSDFLLESKGKNNDIIQIMRRKYYKRGEDNIFGVLFGVGTILTGCVWYFYTYKNAEFWHILKFYLTPGLFFLIAGSIFLIRKSAKRDAYIDSIPALIMSNEELKVIVEKFILSFGKSKNKFAWKCREYAFESEYLKDFTSKLIEKGLNISQENNDDIKKILTEYINIKDKIFLEQTIELRTVHNFNEFKNDGVEFENLIVRLYTAIGYESKRIGGSGDQGGDVIASRNGQSILIQAKFYEGSVNNNAVQQAIAARLHYGCSSAQVITTGVFTKGAIELARSTDVQLIDGDELQRLLIAHLNEVWQ